jgi:hypothetical protein
LRAAELNTESAGGVRIVGLIIVRAPDFLRP